VGVITAVRGSVFDVRFDVLLPHIRTSLRAGTDGEIAIEVLAQIDARHVRSTALTATQGPVGGMAVSDTGGPLMAPVGKSILSRMFDVFGPAIDRQDEPKDVTWRSVHRELPPPIHRSTTSVIFETGKKMIDVLVPLETGGKAGYVAQALVAPGGRVIQKEGPVQVLNFDLLDCTDDGRVPSVAARLHQGRTTNFRTSGGGLAPVYEGPAEGPAEGLAGFKAKGCVPAPHESRAFLLGDNSVQPLAHDRYVALVHGAATGPELAGDRFKLVDWYVGLACGQSEAIVGKTCSWLAFDAQGVVDPHAAQAIDAVAAPTEDQWVTLRALVFGNAAASSDSGVTP